MKGPLPSIEVHCKLDSVGGCQDGMFEMGGMLISIGLAFVFRLAFRCSWFDSNVTGEVTGVGVTGKGSKLKF